MHHRVVRGRQPTNIHETSMAAMTSWHSWIGSYRSTLVASRNIRVKNIVTYPLFLVRHKIFSVRQNLDGTLFLSCKKLNNTILFINR